MANKRTASKKAKSSHLGAGLIVGSIIGVATGFFLKSKDGMGMMKDAEKKSKALQDTLMKNMKNAQDLTKAKYEEMVDMTIAYYMKSKEIAQKDVPEIRKFLMGKWKHIEKEMKSVNA